MKMRFLVAAIRIGMALLAILPSAIGVAEEAPGKIIDLSDWKLTLPVDTDRPGRPDEIVAPQIATFVAKGIFHAAADGTAVVFRATCGGVATSGSSYPRCELREMQLGGRKEAAWGTDDNTVHSLAARLAITHVPAVKPHVVCAQIHDAADDLLEIRVEGKKLQVERAEEGNVMLDRDYRLGTPFDLQIEAGRGHVRVFYNGEQKLDWQVVRRGCYFKAGCYTQSNARKGDTADDYGEVVIHRLELTNRLP